MRVYDSDTDKFIGNLVDISDQGLMLIRERPFEPNTEIRLKIGLPRKKEGHDRILFDACCLWCRRNIHTDFFDTGFKLQNLTPENCETINRLVSEYLRRD
jgi:hypothetical protein